MLPYQQDTKKLERLLAKLFDDNQLTSEDVAVLEEPLQFPKPFSCCCNYSYSNYND